MRSFRTSLLTKEIWIGIRRGGGGGGGGGCGGGCLLWRREGWVTPRARCADGVGLHPYCSVHLHKRGGVSPPLQRVVMVWSSTHIAEFGMGETPWGRGGHRRWEGEGAASPLIFIFLLVRSAISTYYCLCLDKLSMCFKIFYMKFAFLYMFFHKIFHPLIWMKWIEMKYHVEEQLPMIVFIFPFCLIVLSFCFVLFWIR
jgi:hypothetical protein